MPDRYQANHPPWSVAVRTYGKATDPTEMVVVFGVVFHDYGFTFLADRLGITMKTVCAHLYNAMEKNGMRGVSIKYLCNTIDR